MSIRDLSRIVWVGALWVTVIMVALVALSSVGISSAKATGRIDDTDAMHSALLRVVPPGSALADAEKRMVGEGFRCRTLPSYPGQILCERSDTAGWPVSRRWQVQVLSADGRVTDVHVDMGLVGP